jgi:uncharacterized membrane protein
MSKLEKYKKSQISGRVFPTDELVRGSSLRASIVDLIKQDHPDFDPEGYIGITEVNHYRQKYIKELLEKEKGELDYLEKEVYEKLHNSELLSRNLEDEISKSLKIGEKLSDNLAKFGGSWLFIISFFCFILAWIVINVFILLNRGFDPYPFILLNLLLSCLAAVQAPVIIMSQNRQEAKDRLRSQHDYQVNLKAELEINQINDKLDHLILVQMQRLLEIQQIQVDYIDEIREKISRSR